MKKALRTARHPFRITSSHWTPKQIAWAVAALRKIAYTVWIAGRLPLPLYEALLAAKVNVSIEICLRKKDTYWIGKRPEGDVYAGLWAFYGVTLLPTDLKVGGEPFEYAFVRFEKEELSGHKLKGLRLIGLGVAHDRPRGPYIQLIYEASTDEKFTKKDGRWLLLRKIKTLELVPSHRQNILSALQKRRIKRK